MNTPTLKMPPLGYVTARLKALQLARDGAVIWLPITNSAAGLFYQEYAFAGIRSAPHPTCLTFLAVLTMDRPGELEFAGSRLNFAITNYKPTTDDPALLRCMTLEQFDKWAATLKL